MTVRQDITTAALLGTGRQPFTPPPAPGELGAFMARLPADSEAALLGAAAAVSLAERAGTTPPIIDTPAPPACPPETIPVCGPRVADGIALMLGGKHREALPEMLTALAAVGRRVPALLLPELLKQGRQSKDLRGAVLPVLGNRGRWLAAQNREWAWAAQLILETAESPETVWAEGDAEARLEVLTRLRQADPARGLALLQSTWAGETADDRAAFVAALDVGLSEADEPFLEATLRNRGADVRRAVLLRLGRLPASAYNRRMLARAQPLLVGKSSTSRGLSLEVTLPAAHDSAMERDGISQKDSRPAPGYVSLGHRAWWLCQTVGAVPLDYWTRTWQRSPEEILQAAGETEWSAALRRAWERAVQRQPDVGWLEALLRYYLSGGRTISTDLRQEMPCLPRDRWERLVKGTLMSDPTPLHDAHAVMPFLTNYSAPWDTELARTVIASLRQRIVEGTTRDVTAWHVLRLLPVFACRVPPALSKEMAAGWPDLSKAKLHWEAPIHEFVTTLQFRHDLLHEISKETRP